MYCTSSESSSAVVVRAALRSVVVILRSRRTPSVGRTVVARVFVVVVKHLSVVSSSHRRGVVAHSYVVLLVRSGRPVVRPSSVEAV